MSTEELRRNADSHVNKKSAGTNKKRLKILGVNATVDGGFDIIFLILVLALLTTGLVMMFSASYITAKYSYSETKGNPYYYIIRQALFAAVGIFLMMVISRINPELMKKLTWFVAAVAVLLMIVVLFYHTKVNADNSIKRWMKLPGFTLQPSDVGKLALIMALSYTLEKYKKQLERKWWVAPIFACGVLFMCLLVFLESHLSGTVLMFAIGFGMLFLGGVDRRWFILGIVAIVIIGAAVWTFRDSLLKPYQVERLESFFVSEKDYYDVDSRWQTNQSLFALGSGGIFGLGLGNSRQKFMYLPEPQNDFIFAIVGEELGFIRCVVILIFFALVIVRGFMIAAKAKSAYERLLVLGICLQLGIQTVLNILVVTDMMPNTGISLPFFSYGGTALILQLAEMGMVLAVSRTGERRPKKQTDNRG